MNALAERRHEKGVSSLQEPPGDSISARKPPFPRRRQGNKVQLRYSVKMYFLGRNRFSANSKRLLVMLGKTLPRKSKAGVGF
jgi:hypothetical protein